MDFKVVWRPIEGGDYFEQEFRGFESIESVETAIRDLYGCYPQTFHVFHYEIQEDDES